MGILIDTCIWIDVELGNLAPVDIVAVTGTEPVYLSPITIAELKFGAECALNPAIRQQRLAALARIRMKPVLRIDETTGEIFGSLAAQLKAGGKSHRPRIQDLWLASQAVQHGFALLTRNVRYFEDIPGVQIATV
ncbi:MAG: type II toxin-antitoxin system VapC family toxin [Deltaproteobacteria bacterium]|nr:type II toxin-antitoxin system VapC family toxin [Deltaproteobacteria bacterium]